MAKVPSYIIVRDQPGAARKVRTILDDVSLEYTQLFIAERSNKGNYGQIATINATTATAVFANDDDRLHAQIFNLSGATLYVGLDNQVTDDAGAKPGQPLTHGQVWGESQYYGGIWVIAKTGAGSGLKIQWREILMQPAT